MALRRWRTRDGYKPTALFATTHKDRTGGGELYAHQIAKVLDGLFDLRYYTGSTGNLHPDFVRYHGKRHRFTSTALIHRSDLFVSCSHFAIPEPVGEYRNAVVTFFPNPEHRDAVKPYDTVVTCSEFSAQWVRKYWGKKATVIYPYIDLGQYRMAIPKAPKTILNVGRFFREPHGHSKRQDVLIQALSVLHRDDPEWRMVLAGSVNGPSDQQYLDHCRSTAKELGVGEAVEFYPNCPFDDLRALYSGAEFYWHANGYGSDNPYETEHFGIVIAEAMASGCQPIIFNGGGCSSFPVAVWSEPDELARLTLTATPRPQYMQEFVTEWFTESRMISDIRNLFFRG